MAAQAALPAAADEGDDMAGPNAYCNWAVRGRLLVGPLPREAMLADAVAAGCTVFVCLVSERELARSGGHYAQRLQRIAPRTAFEHVLLPVFDKQTAPDADALRVAELVAARVREGRCVYVHCMGGHGRSGVVVAIALARLFGLSAFDALALCERCHSDRGMCRAAPGVFTSPETHEQKDQVYRILSGKLRK